jgi:hypothetical protein
MGLFYIKNLYVENSDPFDARFAAQDPQMFEQYLELVKADALVTHLAVKP